MTDYQKKRLDKEFDKFVKRNFENPRYCKNLDQIRFYVSELSHKIEEFRHNFNYVPGSAYRLLSQYNLLQNQMMYMEFKNSY